MTRLCSVMSGAWKPQELKVWDADVWGPELSGGVFAAFLCLRLSVSGVSAGAVVGASPCGLSFPIAYGFQVIGI